MSKSPTVRTIANIQHYHKISTHRPHPSPPPPPPPWCQVHATSDKCASRHSMAIYECRKIQLTTEKNRIDSNASQPLVHHLCVATSSVTECHCPLNVTECHCPLNGLFKHQCSMSCLILLNITTALLTEQPRPQNYCYGQTKHHEGCVWKNLCKTRPRPWTFLPSR